VTIGSFIEPRLQLSLQGFQGKDQAPNRDKLMNGKERWLPDLIEVRWY
jgi:hypothetical protein